MGDPGGRPLNGSANATDVTMTWLWEQTALRSQSLGKPIPPIGVSATRAFNSS